MIATWLFYAAVRTYKLIKLGGKLKLKARPYTQKGKPGGKQIVIMGDSTGYGIGASKPQNALPGLLGHEYPTAKIDNFSQSGLTTQELVGLLPTILTHKYRLAIIHIGGNDIIRFKKLQNTIRNLEEIVNKVSKKTDFIALYTTGNLGQAPFFPWPTGYIFSGRAKLLRDFGLKLEKKYKKVLYIDLFEQTAQADFANKPKKFYAADMLHLSDAGYAAWHAKLKEKVTPIKF